ncbi:hypothetical protein TYRP_006336 [Tyrophagus putrescentiae]|nr:hypothetical protein TYRP_006336 [Tyrophagus putrescentiae]
MNPPFRFRTSSAPPPPSKLSLAKNVRQQLQHQQQPQKKEEERSFNQRSPHHSEAEKKKAVVNVRAPSPGIIFSPPTFDLSKEGRFAYGMARGSLPMIPALSAANVRPQGIINLQTSLGSASNSKVKKERNQIITAGISSSNDNSANKRPFKRPLFPESTTAINKSNSSSTKKRKEPVIKIGKYDMLGQLGCPNTSTNSLPLLFNHKKPFKSSPVKDIDPADLLELDEKFFID